MTVFLRTDTKKLQELQTEKAFKTAKCYYFVCFKISAQNGGKMLIQRGGLKVVAGLGISGVATGLSWVFYFRALQVGTVSQVAPVDKLSVAIALVLAAVFLGEQLTPQTVIGAGLIVAGTLVLIWG